MTVEYLADRREFIPTVARWHHTEWGHLRPGETVEDRAVRVERDCGHREIPTTFVALAGHQCLGSASLVACDMDIRPALTPWLSGVFVAPEHRRRGGRRGSRRASCAGGAGTRQATSLSFTRPVLALCISDLLVRCRTHILSRAMACPDCGHQMSKQAATCPGCGRRIAFGTVMCSAIFWAAFAVMFFASIIFGLLQIINMRP